MARKDFSILLEKIETAGKKKDISTVTGFNSIVQSIEHIFKTQKGELIANMSLGTNYFTYLYGTDDPGSLEMILAAYLESAIIKIKNVKVTILSQSANLIQFKVNFSLFDGIRYQDNATCFIEIETQ